MFLLLGCESKASLPVTHPGQSPGRLFPLAKGNPSVFSTGCVTSLGFQQAHKQQFPKYCDKNHEQTESQANGRSWASRLRYSEPQIISPMDMSTGWSTLLCCSLHPRDSVSPDGDSHCWEFFPSHSAHCLVLVLSHEMFSVKQKFDLCCDWTPAVPWHWTATASCETHFPHTKKIRGNCLSPLCYWFLILWNEIITKWTNKQIW